MADESTIQDYTMIDDFISKSLIDFNKKVFGKYDEKTGYFEESTSEEDTPETVNSVEHTDTPVPDESSDQNISDMQMYDAVFGPDNSPENNYGPGDRMGMAVPSKSNFKGSSSFQKFGSYAEGKAALINQLIRYQTGKSKSGIKKYDTLWDAMHKYAPEKDKNKPAIYARFVAKKLGVDVNTPINQLDPKQWADAIEIMEGNTKGPGGNNPGNLKIPGRKAAGGIPIANTKQQQYVGLNDPALDSLFMPLEGNNPIRGLDSGQPVYVRDTKGNTAILHGPYDMTSMTGPVYEKRLSKKYKTR